MRVVPTTLRDAREYVRQHHRHHRPPVGGLFAIAAAEGDEVVGVVIVGRPVAMHCDDGYTAEVTRLCTDGSRNACSMLYGAAWRAARAMGYLRLITYTLPDEGGGQSASRWLAMPRSGGGQPLVTSIPSPRRPTSTTTETTMGGHMTWRTSSLIPRRLDIVTRTCARCNESKSLTSYRRLRPGSYTEVCRKCEGAGVVSPKPLNGRLCVVCAVEYPRARFLRRPDGRYAEVCLACTSDPAVRVTLEQEQAAAIVVGALRRIASGRFDGQSGPPDMGVEGMRSQARIALTAIEEAR